MRFFLNDHLDFEYRCTHDSILDLTILLARARQQNHAEDIAYFSAVLARKQARMAEMQVLLARGGY